MGEEELFSEVEVAGDGTRLQLEGKIRFAKADVLTVDPETLARFSQLVDRRKWDFNYVFFPFDLDEQEAGHYERIRVTARFHDQRILAKYLSPSRDNTFVPYDGVATTWGENTPELTWQLDPADDADRVTPQGHRVMCLVQRPKDLAEVDVIMEAEVVVVQTVFYFQRRTAAVRQPGHYRLSFADNTFVRLSG